VTTPDIASAPVKNASIWEDFVDIFYAPVAVFTRRRDGRWALPLLVYVVLSGALLFASRPLMQPMLDRQMAAQMEKMRGQSELSAEQRERALEMQRKVVDSPFALVGGLVFLPVAVFLVALGLWLVGKLFGSAHSLGQSMTIATYASFPRLVVGFIATAILFATGSDGVSSQYAMGLSPAALLPADTSTTVLALLSRFELGTVWATVLLGVGVYVIGRVSKQSAALTAFGVWVLATLLVLGSGAMQA
jgi:hypothetical protein